MLYEIRYVSPRGINFIPTMYWTYTAAKRELVLAERMMLHLSSVELWKFNFWEWRWLKLEKVEPHA